MCRDQATLCDWCVARVLNLHRGLVQSFAREWGVQAPLTRAVPTWEDEAGRALGLQMVQPLGIVDDHARATLARLWVETAASVLRRRAARRAPGAPAST